MTRAGVALLLVACGGRLDEREAAADAPTRPDAPLEDAEGDRGDGNPLPPCRVNYDCPIWPQSGDVCQRGRCCLGKLGDDGICRCGAGPECDLLKPVCCPQWDSPDASCTNDIKCGGP